MDLTIESTNDVAKDDAIPKRYNALQESTALEKKELGYSLNMMAELYYEYSPDTGVFKDTPDNTETKETKETTKPNQIHE